MNIGQLKELIKNLPDSAKVVTGTNDHTYRVAGCYTATAIFYKDDNQIDEDFGEELAENQRRKTVLVVN